MTIAGAPRLASSLVNTAQQVGGALGLAALVTLPTGRPTGSAPPGTPPRRR